MNETRVPQYGSRDNVCIDTMRILDSCRDKDCYEDAKCFLTDYGQEIIEKSGSIRVKDTKVVCCNISADRIQFNKGFYQITIKFYTKCTIECCVCNGKTVEIEGIVVSEKKVVLYGGEGCVRTFRSNSENDFCTPCTEAEEGSDKPSVVVDLVDPIALSAKIREKCDDCCCCCCSCSEIPQKVYNCISGGNLCDYPPSGSKQLLISLGFFSVIRIERPSQLVISANEYSIPDKECLQNVDDDPCTVFSRMAFPISEFSPSGTRNQTSCRDIGQCDCKKR